MKEHCATMSQKDRTLHKTNLLRETDNISRLEEAQKVSPAFQPRIDAIGEPQTLRMLRKKKLVTETLETHGIILSKQSTSFDPQETIEAPIVAVGQN